MNGLAARGFRFGLPSPSDLASNRDRELLLAWNDKMLGSQTDWLLTLDIPVWDREEERKMP